MSMAVSDRCAVTSYPAAMASRIQPAPVAVETAICQLFDLERRELIHVQKVALKTPAF